MLAQIKMAMAATALATGGGTDLPRMPEWSLVSAASVQPATVAAFTIAFPTPATIDAHPPETGDDAGYWTYDCAGGQGASFNLRIDQFPANIRTQAATPRMYTLLLRSYAAQSALTLQSSTPVQIGDRPGLEGVFTSASGETEVRRVIMVGRRIFQVSYRFAAGVDASTAGRAFLESFQIAPS